MKKNKSDQVNQGITDSIQITNNRADRAHRRIDDLEKQVVKLIGGHSDRITDLETTVTVMKTMAYVLILIVITVGFIELIAGYHQCPIKSDAQVVSEAMAKDPRCASGGCIPATIDIRK